MSEYGEIETGQESAEIDQLHQASGSEVDYDNQFSVYEADSARAESTSFDTGSSVEYSDGNGAHYSAQDFTSYDHSEAETDSVFAASGAESYSASEFSELDALQARFDAAFTSGTFASN